MARKIRIGLSVDPIGTETEIHELCDLLDRKKIRATVTVVGRIGNRIVSSIDYLKPFLKSGHEICNHTDSHPARIGYMEKEEQEKEILIQHDRLQALGREWGRDLSVKGFRAPLYAFDLKFFSVLKKCGYRWDSSSIYAPLLGIPFRSFLHQDIVEIPVLFPDDVTLIERMLQSPEEIFRILWNSYSSSEEYFVWNIHPYGAGKDRKMLSNLNDFLTALEQDGASFLTFSEIAEELRKKELRRL